MLRLDIGDYMRIIGRKIEQQRLRRLCDSPRPEFAVVYGRRRVGKTFLIREYFSNSFAFHVSGIAGGVARVQLQSFNQSLADIGCPDRARDWFEAFRLLRGQLERDDVRRDAASGKRVVFIDEMPWLDAPRTDFRAALELFWNKWGASQPDLLLIACGSASSWIVKHLFKNRGGLHNRVTARIKLEPFTLAECAEYYRVNGIPLSQDLAIESYMVFGGIPFYLDLLDRRLGLVQNIDNLCFSHQGELREEFDELYHSLFKHAERHVSVVRTLGTRLCGLSRREISEGTGIGLGGTLSATLGELEASGFIRRYHAYGKDERDAIYQLIDPFSLFYLRFMENQADERFWSNNYQSGRVHAWEGYAFELVALLHLDQIRATLGIAGVAYDASTWRSAKSNPGAQVDLVLDRNDGIINLCEMKFAREPYQITKAYDEMLRHKTAAFRDETKTRKALHLTLVSPYGVKRNAYWQDVQAVIAADDLFA